MTNELVRDPDPVELTALVAGAQNAMRALVLRMLERAPAQTRCDAAQAQEVLKPLCHTKVANLARFATLLRAESASIRTWMDAR